MSRSTERFVFVIDTDKYAGNFERETCAFVTGQVGECGVGDEEADLFEQAASLGMVSEDIQEEIEDKILQVDDEGTFRPTQIWSTPSAHVDESGAPYNSVGIFFEEQPSPKLVGFMKKRAQEYCNPGSSYLSDYQKYEITGFRLLREVTTVTEEELSI